MKKAKQKLVNASAQVARAEANLTVGNSVDPVNAAVRASESPDPADGGRDNDARSPGPGDDAESAGQDDGALASPRQSRLPPIYLALAISVNLAADYQKNNRNVVERD